MTDPLVHSGICILWQAAAVELAAESLQGLAAAAADAAGVSASAGKAAVDAALQALGEHVGFEQRRHATYAACFAAKPSVSNTAQRAAHQGTQS